MRRWCATALFGKTYKDLIQNEKVSGKADRPGKNEKNV
jgi:hypothetical protein